MKKRITISLYWKCQFIFWSAAALQWAYIAYTGTGFNWWLAIIHFAADLFIYILPSHFYRNLSKKLQWYKLPIQQLLLRVVPAIFILGLIFMLLTISKNYLIRFWFQPGFTGSLRASFAEQWFITFITGIRLMAIWLLAYYGYHYAQREIKAVKETGRLELMAKEAAFNNLTAQLNPHFFFNALNSIKALVAENPKAARRAIDILSEMVRTSLYDNEEKLVSLQEEMAVVKDYLELEKIRLEEKLRLHIDVDDALLKKQVLRFSVQLLVENAIKHGISKIKEGGEVYIHAVQNHSALLLTVSNTGQLNKDFTKGMGLNNLAERLQLQFGDKAGVALEQATNNTVTATIKIPAHE